MLQKTVDDQGQAAVWLLQEYHASHALLSESQDQDR